MTLSIKYLLPVVLLLSSNFANAATAVIKKVWIEHDVTINGKKAMKVHCKFTVEGMKGKKGAMGIWVFNEKGQVHRVTSDYKTTSGDPYFRWEFQPNYASANYNDYWYAPYVSQLNLLPGKHTYKVRVCILDDRGKHIAQSQIITFTGTGGESKNQSPSQSQNRSNNNSNRSNSSNSSKGKVTRQWRTDMPGGGYTEYTQYANGTMTSHTVQKCIHCHGSAVCAVCFGTGGTTNAYTGIYYPCGSCLRSGRCKYCSGTGEQHFYVNTNAAGQSIGIANDNMPPVVSSGGGGNSSSSNSNSSRPRESNSSRYGYYTCPTCYGTGTCQTCLGDGWVDGALEHACPNCRSRIGKCSVCNGTGKKYGVK